MGKWVMCAVLALVAAPVMAQRVLMSEFQAKVIHVDDGDTVVALQPGGARTRVRLANIDAPETSKNRCKPGQPYAERAEQTLSELVKGRTLRFVCYDVDRYDRQVCDLMVGGDTASRKLVAAGLAWANRASPRYLRDRSVGDLELQARAMRVGLWSRADAVAPWQWRKEVWQSTCQGADGKTGLL